MSRKRGKNYNRFRGAEGFYDKLSGLNPSPIHVNHPIHNACIMPYATASAIKIRSECVSE